MNRREFSRAAAATVLASALPIPACPVPATSPPLLRGKGGGPRLSIMLWTVFRDLPFEERLQKVAEAGYYAVELVNEFRGWQEADFARVAALRRGLGLTFDATAGLVTGIADPSAREKFLDEVAKMLPVLQKLECSNLIVLSGNAVPGLSREVQYQSCIEGLQRAADLAARNDVTLLLENIDSEENPRYFLTSSREGFEIVRRVGRRNVRLLYDLYHEQIAEGNLIAKLEKNIEQIGLVHVADVPGRHQPGTGEIDYGNVFRKLAQLHYDGYIAMEFLPAGDAVAALRDAAGLANRSWHEAYPAQDRRES